MIGNLEEDKMEDSDSDLNKNEAVSDEDDSPVTGSQDFIQEEYDLRLLLSNVLTRTNQNLYFKKYFENGNDVHLLEFQDEFKYFTESVRNIFQIS